MAFLLAAVPFLAVIIWLILIHLLNNKRPFAQSANKASWCCVRVVMVSRFMVVIIILNVATQLMKSRLQKTALNVVGRYLYSIDIMAVTLCGVRKRNAATAPNSYNA